MAASLLNEVDANKQQSHTLADLRDTLLPRAHFRRVARETDRAGIVYFEHLTRHDRGSGMNEARLEATDHLQVNQYTQFGRRSRALFREIMLGGVRRIGRREEKILPEVSA